ncbi:MAG: Ribosomal protein L11 methyltransferase [Firmicutes bacterium]|nr:Ribosomal protein L11 methyltransferase [Bacillota bacterium]
MKWMEITVVTSQEAKEAVADIFYRAGANGVVVEDASPPLLAEDVEDYSLVTLPDIPLEEVRITAYLPLLEGTFRQIEEIRLAVSALPDFGLDPGRGEVLVAEILEEDWASAWKEYYQPIVVGPKLVIKPSWEEFTPAPGQNIVELDPGMAFGTGSHATTVMCLEFMHGRELAGKRVLDLGCGSGILALAAAKLGAAEVVALDYDPLAVKVAAENVRLNQLEGHVAVAESHLFAAARGRYDFIVANIIARIIIELLPSLGSYLAPDGMFLASGIIRDKLDSVLYAIEHNGFLVQQSFEQREWVTLAVVRKVD